MTSANSLNGGHPQAGTWTIDTPHSFVTFTIEHFTVAFARGIGAGPTGTIVIAEDPAASSVTATIDPSTLTTANAARDEKIHGPDMLDVEHHPTIEFASRAVSPAGEGRYKVEGDLTLRGVTRPIGLDLVVHGVVTDVWSKTRLGMTATTELRRSEFGAGEWGHVPLAAGGFMVPDVVQVTMEIEATLEP